MSCWLLFGALWRWVPGRWDVCWGTQEMVSPDSLVTFPVWLISVPPWSMFSSVDFPLPLPPSKATRSPGSSRKVSGPQTFRSP